MWPESLQAKVSLIAGIVFALVLAVYMVARADYFNLLTIAIFTVPLLVLTSYDIQCIVTGQCEVYSWIKTILFLITVAIAFYVQALRAHVSRGGGQRSSAPPSRQVVYVTSNDSESEYSSDSPEARAQQAVKDSKKDIKKYEEKKDKMLGRSKDDDKK